MERIDITIPAIPLRGITVLPRMVIHFDISKGNSVTAVEQALQSSGQKIFLVLQKDKEADQVKMEDLYPVGVTAYIRNVARLPHDIMRVMVEGMERAVLLGLDESDGILKAQVEVTPREQIPTGTQTRAMVRALKDLFEVYAAQKNGISKDLRRQLLRIDDLEILMDQMGASLPFDARVRQRILEAEDYESRYAVLCTCIAEETEVLRIRSAISQKVKERIDKNQREYLLREQMKVIREELGEELPMQEAERWQEAADALIASDKVKEKIRTEIARFRSLSSNSAEASVSRTYIETLLDMPWDRMSEDNTDLANARRVLQEDHYGLDKVKERVLEFLAVRSLAGKGDSPILCLVGPPGTGKTSIARSVARAMDRRYIRISLGGVRDEAEIRGHRRTYIGAMPGRIVSGIRSAGVKNPLMLLDEVDKLGSSLSGDPSSALLEVLDSEQNCRFSDHYIEIPVDLSEVMFIATANDPAAIPKPLKDRMEIIEISSYTQNEKLHIAREHLVPKQLVRHGLTPKMLSFTNGALDAMILGYTREAGVRALERRIGEICRKAARQILEEGRTSVRIRKKDLEAYLGQEQHHVQMRNDRDEEGIVRGLAWTSVGGVTLQIEVNRMPGSGEISLTGQMGDVMKESARAGISYIRSIASEYGIAPSFFKENDIHVHIPEGAVPKDGPSAGITMATAILSAAAHRRVRADVAMTGEITLRGRVLAVGGLKEKLLAAKAAGMKTVIVPEANRRDIAQISAEITGGMEIVYADSMEQVLEHAFVSEGPEKKPVSGSKRQERI